MLFSNGYHSLCAVILISLFTECESEGVSKTIPLPIAGYIKLLRKKH